MDPKDHCQLSKLLEQPNKETVEQQRLDRLAADKARAAEILMRILASTSQTSNTSTVKTNYGK